MRTPLTITRADVTPAALLRQATALPGAWAGIRIAALLLILAGWRAPAIARLFQVSRVTACAWIRDANTRGIGSVQDRPRPGRPPRVTPAVARRLAAALDRSPAEVGIQRSRWDGLAVVEYLRSVCGVRLQPRQARNWLHRLGLVLKVPGYRLVQATGKGVRRFRRGLKKNSRRS